MAELHESQDALAGDMVDGVEGVEEVEEIVVDAMPEPTHPARKRKSTWRGQAELINLPYKASSIFKDEKLLETIKISEDSDTKIIRKTGLLDDHELDLDLASDGSDDAEIQVLSNTDSVSAKETNNSMVTLSIGGNFQIYHLMFLARPSGAPDNIALGLHSTFDVQALRRQLKKAQASRSGAQCPLWALGFDTKVFGHAHRLLPTEPLVDNIVLTRLKASTEKKKFEEYLDSLRLYKEAAWVELQCIFDPERIGTMDEPSPQFLQLATAFFSGKEIDEDCGVVDKTQKTPIILDLGLDDLDNLSGEPSDIQEQEPVYKITNGTGDRAKVMAQDPLRDPVLATFLVDLIMSREIEKAIAQQARYKFMKVFHSSERSFIGSRLENIEKTLKQGNAYLWKKPGPVDLLLLPGGTWTYFIPASGSFNKNDTGDVVEPESRENATAEFQETKLPAAAENSAQPEPKSKKSKKKKKKPVKVNESIDSQDDPLNKVAEKTDDPESTVAPDTSTAQHTGADVTSFTVDELVAKNVSVLETAEGTNKGNGWQEVTKARAVSKTKTKASRTVSRLTASSNARLVSSTSASTIVNISKSRPSVVPSVTNAQASTIDRRVSPLMETAVITVPKVRQTRTYLTPTITPPELVDSDFPPLSTTNEPDRSDSTLRTPDHKIQSTLFKSITPSSELLANSPDFDYSSGKPVICNHNKQETGQEEAVVPNDLSWADLTSPTKFHPHQRYASLQTVSTRSKEEEIFVSYRCSLVRFLSAMVFHYQMKPRESPNFIIHNLLTEVPN
ncbi:hypothetical protein BDZ45DRAFT_98738 [Acephala macrosclerotiorum]|nr:hypothetical protein BDZ45DRAFT_98738 [Acephala macrosclerotiorum]